jgi:PadR family transcriptional regulator, regulatory protein AphA
MSRINTTRYAVLGMLTLGSKSAYEIQKKMRCSINYFWSESDGQLYPTLKRLTDEGLLTFEEETTPGGRSKKIYSLTKTGRETLKDWLSQPEKKHPIRLELLLKLFFAYNVNKKMAIKHLETEKKELEEEISIYKKIEKKLGSPSDCKKEFYAGLTLDYGIKEVEMRLSWCDQSIKKIKDWS